jgi:hypothetical protein
VVSAGVFVTSWEDSNNFPSVFTIHQSAAEAEQFASEYDPPLHTWFMGWGATTMIPASSPRYALERAAVVNLEATR